MVRECVQALSLIEETGRGKYRELLFHVDSGFLPPLTPEEYPERVGGSGSSTDGLESSLLPAQLLASEALSP